MLQQQEQLRALQGRQAALLALQHKAEQAIAVMDDSEKVAETTPGHHTVPGRQPARSPLHQRVPIRETTGSLSGVSITSELNEELNDLIQHFHNQLRDSQPPAVPDNRRQAESLSLTREISQSRNPSVSEHLPDEKVQLFSKMRVLQEKKQKWTNFLRTSYTSRSAFEQFIICAFFSLSTKECGSEKYNHSSFCSCSLNTSGQWRIQ